MNYYGINRKMNVEAFIHKYKMTAQSGAITGDPFGKKRIC